MVEEFNENNNSLLGGFDVVAPSLLVGMDPISPPILIPAGGGSFDFTVSVENVSPVMQIFDFWIMADLPNGTPYGPILLRENLSLIPGANISRTMTQQIPAGAPPGDYYYYGIAGDYPDIVMASEGFPFTKEAGVDLGSSYNDWGIYGWEEVTLTQTQNVEQFSIDIRPNPFNPVTQLEFNLPHGSIAEISVYDIHGRQVAVLNEGYLMNGSHTLQWNASDQASGVYLLNFRSAEINATKKLLLLK
jgi:hypothetical protein